MTARKKGNGKGTSRSKAAKPVDPDARAEMSGRGKTEEAAEDVAPTIDHVPAIRPRIEPLPSLPETSEVEEADAEEPRPALRLAGEKQMGGLLPGSLMRLSDGPAFDRRRNPRRTTIPMPEEHAPRELLGDAAALFQLARHDRAEDVRQLLENGADPNLNDDPGNVHLEAVSFLCGNEDIGEGSQDGIKFGRTACHMAAVRGYNEVVKALLDGGCDVNLVDHAGKAPLMRASRAGFLDTARLLVEAGADVNASDLRQSTALLRAADNGHAEVVRFLLDSGAEVDARDCLGRTALLAAASGVHPETVRALLAAGADPLPRDEIGTDALFAAIDAVEPEDPNVPSPFHVIREERVLAVVEQLLDAGAQDEPDAAGIRPSERAEERGHANVAALLRERG